MIPPEDAQDEELGELDLFLAVAARTIVQHEDPEELRRWIFEHAGHFIPQFLGDNVDEQARRAIAEGLTRGIWNATPLPGNGYRPRPLPKPGRNDPCPCGSGAKYKRCCARVSTSELAMDPNTMLEKVLELEPMKALRGLPYRNFGTDVIGTIGKRWFDKGEVRRACSLLEPVFSEGDVLDVRADLAFDTLLDCYDELGNPRKKQNLIRKVAQCPDKELRSVALQRMTAVAADRGDLEEAWRLFHDAQRASPEDPSLAHLEIILLLSSGERERAKERARYWLARLRRRRQPELETLIEFLEKIIADEDAAMFEVSARQTPMLQELKTLVDSAGEIDNAAHRIEVGDFGDGERFGKIVPDKSLAALEEEWWEIWQASAPYLYDVDLVDDGLADRGATGVWLEFIQSNPACLDSFEVLDDLVRFLEEYDYRAALWSVDIIIKPMLERAEALLLDALSRHDLAGAALPWVVTENRPALSLLCDLADVHVRSENWEAALPRLERLVCTLNPTDNLGARFSLMRTYLYLAQYEKALSLSSRYPDDLPELEFGKVLALYSLERRGEALSALAAAHDRSPLVLKYLIAKDPRMPKFSEFGISVGGKDEAWLVRQHYLELFERAGAMDWLRQFSRSSSARTKTGD